MSGCKFVAMDGGGAIICGSKPDHECDDNGELFYEFSDGFSGTLLSKSIKEKLNPGMCNEDKLYFLSQKDIHQVGCSITCSYCGRPASMDMFKL